VSADHKLVELYRQHLHARHLTPLTVKHRIEHIERFLAWLPPGPGGHWPDIRDVTMRQLQDYHDDLLRRKKPDGHPVSPAYRHTQVHAVQNFYAFLKKRRRIVLDPFEAFPKLRKPHRLPKGVITNDQVLRWMAQPDLSTPEGFRNRAMMEVFYSTGLRGAELCKLTAYEIDVKDHTVRVVMGKGKKDRLVPIGKVALAFVVEYLATVRPILQARNRYRNTDRLFLSDRGTALHTGLVRNTLCAIATPPGCPAASPFTASVMPAPPKC